MAAQPIREIARDHGGEQMTTIEQIQTAIETLTPEEYARLRAWLLERDAAAWDRQIAEDAAAGKLDFLRAEALAEKAAGQLRDL